MINAVCACVCVCVCVLSLNVYIATWSEFKSWLSEKKQKRESALSQVDQQKLQHVQQLVGEHTPSLVRGCPME